MPNLKYIPRLAPQATELIDRSVTVEFQFDGRTVRAHEGDTIAAALYAAGVSTLSRSFKYHRSRGLLCGAGRCPNCLVSVDGVPNVRACTQRVREGMKVRHQNAWPSLAHDFLSILDRLHWLMPVGFYYKAFHRPKLLWPLVQRVFRRVGVWEPSTSTPFPRRTTTTGTTTPTWPWSAAARRGCRPPWRRRTGEPGSP